MGPEIRFPNLGIEIPRIHQGFSVFGFEIRYYGVILATGMLAGILLACFTAKREGKNKEVILDFALLGILSAIIGARLYYVLFSLPYYLKNPLEIFNLRGGGLAIYGAVIFAALAMVIFCKKKGINFFELADYCVPGLILGQSIGRWGNFVNAEAFGGYTNGLFVMQLREDIVNPAMINNTLHKAMLQHPVTIDGASYIQVHPTFFYESMWNLIFVILLVLFMKKRKAKGQNLWMYFIVYGIGRFWIEGLRTDQLILFNTGLPVSQVLSLILVVAGIVMMVISTKKKELFGGAPTMTDFTVRSKKAERREEEDS